jgi:hypothetical protein
MNSKQDNSTFKCEGGWRLWRQTAGGWRLGGWWLGGDSWWLAAGRMVVGRWQLVAAFLDLLDGLSLIQHWPATQLIPWEWLPERWWSPVRRSYHAIKNHTLYSELPWTTWNYPNLSSWWRVRRHNRIKISLKKKYNKYQEEIILSITVII